MKDDPDRTEEIKHMNRIGQMAKLRISWDAMGEMANSERALAAGTIQDLMDEVEAWRQAMQKAERDLAELRAERDEARRSECLAFATYSWNPDLAAEAQKYAMIHGWDCFKADDSNYRGFLGTSNPPNEMGQDGSKETP